MNYRKIPTASMMYTRLQYHTNTIVGKHGIQTFKFVVVVYLFLLLSFDDFVPVNACPLLFLDKWFVHIYLNANFGWATNVSTCHDNLYIENCCIAHIYIYIIWGQRLWFNLVYVSIVWNDKEQIWEIMILLYSLW